MAINATPVDMTCLASPVRFVNAAISASITPMPIRPIFNVSHCIEPNSRTPTDNTFMAADNIRIPVAVETTLPLNLAKFRNKAISPINTPIPISPFTSSVQLNCDKLLHADANIFIAAAKDMRLNAPFIITFVSFAMILDTTVNTAEITVMPVRPLAIPSQLR